jgi:hypothetical protein
MNLTPMENITGGKGKFSWMLDSIKSCNRHILYKRALDLMASNNAEDKAIAELIQKVLFINSMNNYEHIDQNLHTAKIPETLDRISGELSHEDQKILNCM